MNKNENVVPNTVNGFMARRDQLILKSRSLSAQLESATGEKVLEPKYSTSNGPDAVMAAITVLEYHCQVLEGKIPKAAPAAAPTQPTSATLPTDQSAQSPQTHSAPAQTLNPMASRVLEVIQWNPDARIAEARERADDKPSGEKAGDCGDCSGTGRCADCNGSGKKTGKTESCAKCEGDGRCSSCNGNGSGKSEKQSGQGGKAKDFNPDAAILAARGVKSVTELRTLNPTRFGRD